MSNYTGDLIQSKAIRSMLNALYWTLGSRAARSSRVGAMRIHAPESTPIKTEPIPSSSTNKEPSIWSDFDEVASIFQRIALQPV
ncbi:unnamed protein product, partial [Brenthis ino]